MIHFFASLVFDLGKDVLLFYNLIILGCPSTPVRGWKKTEDGGRLVATVEEALASLTTEMVSHIFNQF